MTVRKETVSLEITYEEDGSIDESATLQAFEKAVGGRIKITDWYGMMFAKLDYPHLNEEQMMTLINTIDTGDYDESISKDIRRDVLDATLNRADIEAWEGQFDKDRDEADEFDPDVESPKF